ncbi:MAG: ATP phosphoribosyltransferase regulatory subunit [Synergistaceae bacterium]|nr:ATP phosphoribosyltransferase regulatory subunit [Synergistaceae bacterium]
MLNLRLRPEEKAALNLRALYEDYHYKYYRMSRFEEYDFYADKKDFLTSKRILTFTDTNGRLMALRPDVTLSIIKHSRVFDGIQKFYYDEKVYRVPKNANNFQEISQSGIECIGNLTLENLREVVELAILSLKTIAGEHKYILDIADAGIIAEILRGSENKQEILKCLAEKNIHELQNMNAPEEIISLAEGEEKISSTKYNTFYFLDEILEGLKKYHDVIRVDYSVVNNLNYYNGIVFRGFIEGIPESVLSGGQYDTMMRLMGRKDAKAIGFAVYLDEIGRL